MVVGIPRNSVCVVRTFAGIHFSNDLWSHMKSRGRVVHHSFQLLARMAFAPVLQVAERLFGWPR